MTDQGYLASFLADNADILADLDVMDQYDGLADPTRYRWDLDAPVIDVDEMDEPFDV